MAVLPTGFGKSMIFAVFALARQKLSTTCTRTCIIVISPLKTIIDGQISEILSLNFSAMELSSDKVNLVRNNPPQFLYCSARSDKCKRHKNVSRQTYSYGFSVRFSPLELLKPPSM